MTDDTLVEAKRRVSRAVLGRNGIHGVGTVGLRGLVILHIDPNSGGLPDGLLNQARALAQPFDLCVVEDEEPTVATLNGW